MTWHDGTVYEGRWHMEDRVDDTTVCEWDRFFMKTIPEQRAFMKDFMKKYPNLIKIKPVRCAPLNNVKFQGKIARHSSSPAQLTQVW